MAFSCFTTRLKTPLGIEHVFRWLFFVRKKRRSLRRGLLGVCFICIGRDKVLAYSVAFYNDFKFFIVLKHIVITKSVKWSVLALLFSISIKSQGKASE